MSTTTRSMKRKSNGTPRWLQGITVGWTALEFGLLGFIVVGLALSWPLDAIAQTLWVAPGAPTILLFALLVGFYMGDLAILLTTYRLKKRSNTAQLSPKGGPRKLLLVHLVPGVSVAHRFIYGMFFLGLSLAHIALLLIWDAAFLLLSVPLQFAGVLGEKFGKATDTLDVVRERMRLALQRVHAATAPY